MTIRRHAREVAFQYLYHFDLRNQLSIAPENLNHHFTHFSVGPKVRGFAQALVEGALQTQTELDQRIDQTSSNWKISRMSVVDRSLLRLGTFELLYLADIPSSVTLDEAVELAKRYGSDDSPKFINGVLDAIRAQGPIEAGEAPGLRQDPSSESVNSLTDAARPRA